MLEEAHDVFAPWFLSLVTSGPAPVQWTAPHGCPDEAYVQDRIASHLQGAPVDPSPAVARATVSGPDDGQWSLSLSIGDEQPRELTASTCEALADAAALMIAISLQPAATTEPLVVPEPAQAAVDPVVPTSTPGSGPGNETPSRTSVRTSDRPRSAAAFGPPSAILGVAVSVEGVGLPAVGAGLGGRVGAQWGPLRMALQGGHFFRRERDVTDGLAAAYRLSTGGLELGGVLALGRAPAGFELYGVGQIEVGVLRGDGVGAEPSLVQRHLWVAPGAGVGAMWTPRGFVAIGLRADLLFPLRRQEFVISELSAGTTGQVDARGALVVEFRLPAQ